MWDGVEYYAKKKWCSNVLLIWFILKDKFCALDYAILLSKTLNENCISKIYFPVTAHYSLSISIPYVYNMNKSKWVEIQIDILKST